MQVDVKDAAALFPELLRLVEQGETVLITRAGQLIAELAARRAEEKYAAESVPVKGQTWLEPLNDTEKEEWLRTVDDELLCGEI